MEDVEDMTEEQRELMEFLAASRDQMMDQVAAGFLDLKQDIQEVKVSNESGCSRILRSRTRYTRSEG